MKPWMRKGPDETEREWSRRLTRTCCWCGRQDEDFPASDAHEMNCARRPEQGRRPAASETDDDRDEVR
ncbi:hypothetical protein [Actinoalloteichus fjordicus]|uniref:Uncharacterized protein n=1 Tax=Actinoalloteichus fjordicus TaxID=1612552 RepID=A0AAC9LBW2_9PSEU|nr:hypothetical protein [Actinoalloteichus fjordicus]APU14064.1 hypothetical protein UA74_10005 [Actinoalloteichus fjordicus]